MILFKYFVMFLFLFLSTSLCLIILFFVFSIGYKMASQKFLLEECILVGFLVSFVIFAPLAGALSAWGTIFKQNYCITDSKYEAHVYKYYTTIVRYTNDAASKNYNFYEKECTNSYSYKNFKKQS